MESNEKEPQHVFYGTSFNLDFVKKCKSVKELQDSQSVLWLDAEDREARFKEVFESVHGTAVPNKK